MKRKRSFNGNGARTFRKKRRTFRGSQSRFFVPRTRGPLIGESKYYETQKTASAVSEATTWAGSEQDPTSVNTLIVPVQGANIGERIGRRIAVYKIALRGVLVTPPLPDQADIIGSCATRLILYQDKQTNGVQAQGEELMAVGDTPTGTPIDTTPLAFSAFQNLANLGRFRILKDLILTPRIVTAGTDGTNTNSLCVSDVPFKIVVKFKKPVIMKFNDVGTNTVGDIVDNSFHLIALKSGTSFVSNLSYQCRGYYKDA